jgi:AcrR family transcriptional regulator
MNVLKELERTAETDPGVESAKRRQIVEGARRVFLAQGFDAASMGEIARAASVSKGTLYVYFENKEELFAAIVREECQAQAEQIFDLDPGEHDVGAVLTRLGIEYEKFLVGRPGGLSPLRAVGGLSPLRTVIAIADRMPEIGRRFYETGPARGIALLASYLRAQVAAGVLMVEDCEVAAAQFMDSCLATLFKPMLLNCSGPPDQAQIEHVVGIAVRTFLAAYQVR